LASAGGAAIRIVAASLKIEGLCIFNSRGGDTGALGVNVSRGAEISVMTVAAGADFEDGGFPLYEQTVMVDGKYFKVSYSNVTLYKQAAGVSGFDLDERDGESSMEFILIQNCSAEWAVRFASADRTASRIENLNIVHTAASTALMTFDGPCNVATSCFMGNTGAGACSFTAAARSGAVRFTDCVTDQEFSGDRPSIVFVSCRTSAETTTVAFLALNTLQCIGKSSGFFENFTTEEIIANIICAFGLAVALIETALYFMKEGLCGDKEDDDADYEDDISEVDEEEDEGHHHHHHSHHHKA
jgi:hypothetical protein